MQLVPRFIVKFGAHDFSARLVYIEEELWVKGLWRLRGVVIMGAVGIENVLKGPFLVVMVLGRGIIVLDMLEQLGQGGRI